MDISEFKRNQIAHRHPWETVRAKIIRQLINKYNPHCSHILDVGSGDAFVIKYLCANITGKEYTAVDIAYTENIINALLPQDNCKINFLQQLPANLHPKADCVLLLDVLEHCENDKNILKQLNNDSLTHSPIFFITVPAFQNLFSQHDKLLFHYRRYSVKKLKSLCEESNYEIIHCGYFFTSLLLIRCIQLLLEYIGFRKANKSIDNWNGSPVLSGLISTFLWFDFVTGRFFSLMGIRIPGLTAFCICRLLPL